MENKKINPKFNAEARGAPKVDNDDLCLSAEIVILIFRLLISNGHKSCQELS
jgi:hypothetical protein